MNLSRWLGYVVFGKWTPKSRKKRRISVRRPARCAPYRAWIRTLPCAACGVLRGVECAHTGIHGLGQKACDFQCIPLCAVHHRTGPEAIHRIGRKTFEQLFGWKVDDLVQQLNAEWREQRG